MIEEDLWARAQAHRTQAFDTGMAEQKTLLRTIDARIRSLAFEIPQTQASRYPLSLSFFPCNKEKLCTHCPHPQWIRWVPNPLRLGKRIPSRVENPGRVLRGNIEGLRRYREVRDLLALRQEILGSQTQLTRKVHAQLTRGKLCR